jgi:hypothetical protein
MKFSFHWQQFTPSNGAFFLMINQHYCPGIFWSMSDEASTDPPAGDKTEAEECYTEQRRLEEEEQLLARGPGEDEGDGNLNLNPNLLDDVSMDDVTDSTGGRQQAGSRQPNPTRGEKGS